MNSSKSLLELAYHKILPMFFPFDHPADFAVSLDDNLDILHFDVDADIVEWESNMFTFLPDSFIKIKHHLERVVVEIGLCGCTQLSSDWLVPEFLKGAAILIYCLRWATTQSSLFLNVFSAIGDKWPGLVVFKDSGTSKTTSSLEIFM